MAIYIIVQQQIVDGFTLKLPFESIEEFSSIPTTGYIGMRIFRNLP